MDGLKPKMIQINHLFYSTHSSSFLKHHAYITRNATKQLSDITRGI